MNRILKLALFLLALPLISTAATATFNYTFATPACSATVNVNCIPGFAVGTVANGVFTQMAACPLPANPTGTVNGITCNFMGTVPLGSATFAVVALGTTAAGPVQSPLTQSNQTTVTIMPSSPGGVVIVFP